MHPLQEGTSGSVCGQSDPCRHCSLTYCRPTPTAVLLLPLCSPSLWGPVSLMSEVDVSRSVILVTYVFKSEVQPVLRPVLYPSPNHLYTVNAYFLLKNIKVTSPIAFFELCGALI